MRLLVAEDSQNGTCNRARHQQVEDPGAELDVLNGVGTTDF